jgi:hypothetical protein
MSKKHVKNIDDFTYLDYNLSKEIKLEKKMSIHNIQTVPSRITLTLPTKEEYRTKLEKLGIQWVSSIMEGCFSAKAQLPEGWTVTPESEKNFTLLDEKGVPRIAVWMADEVFDQYARVNFLRPGKEKIDREIHLIQSEYEERVHQLRKEYDFVWNKMMIVSPDITLSPKKFIPRYIVDSSKDPDIGG